MTELLARDRVAHAHAMWISTGRDELGTAAFEDELAQLVHDLRSPLAAIGLDIEVMMAERESTGAAASASLARMRRNIVFIDRLFYNLADLCSLKDGRLTLCRSRCDLRTLIDAVVSRVVPAHDLSRVVVDRGDACIATIDELRIERVVANLLDNALKYTPRAGAIAIHVATESHYYEVSVCDTGPGVPAHELETIFEPYQRGTSSRGRVGSGLGLYASKRLVEAHGGQIGVDSICGVGTRFFFRLPIIASVK